LTEVPSAPTSPLEPIGAALRPTLLFVASYALTITPHEASHALYAYSLGFNSTLFQMWVDPDAAAASARQLAGIASAGPVFSLTVGLTCGLFYLRLYRHKPAGLFWLMMAMAGIYAFLGPAATAAFGGDFHAAFRFLGISAVSEWIVSAIGIMLLAAFMFRFGEEMMRWAPSGYGRGTAIICTTVAPWLLGLPLIIAIYWPLPRMLVISTISGSAFWLFAVLGATFGAPQPGLGQPAAFRGMDLFVLALAVIMVRLLAHGLRIAH
jgi:hypothetical protein